MFGSETVQKDGGSCWENVAEGSGWLNQAVAIQRRRELQGRKGQELGKEMSKPDGAGDLPVLFRIACHSHDSYPVVGYRLGSKRNCSILAME